ncbi:MAG: hypothetical protein IKT70_02290 [Clostridia bacterium]|nr:hypothetical protein [Clostridia bacterium]
MDDKITWEDLEIIFTKEFVDTLKLIYQNKDSILRLAKKRQSALKDIENMLKDIEEKKYKDD